MYRSARRGIRILCAAWRNGLPTCCSSYATFSGNSEVSLASGRETLETKGRGWESNRYALLGLFRRQAGRGRSGPVRSASVAEPAVAAEPQYTELRPGALRVRSAVHAGRYALVPVVLRRRIRCDLGPALPLPRVPAPATDAGRDRVVEPHAAVR